MKKILIILCVFLSACAVVPKDVPVSPKQQPAAYSGIKGLDVLGLAKQRADIIRDEIDPNTAIGFLDVSFGDPYPNLETVVSGGRVVATRDHLGDGTVLNHSCSAQEHDLNLLKQRAIKYQAFVDKHPDLKSYVSPWLEHGCTDQTLVRSWYATLKTYAPRVSGYVCSTYRGWCPPDVLREGHGSTGTASIRSNDGVSIYDSNSSVYQTSGSVLTLAWSSCDNLRNTGEKVFVPISQRVDYCTRGDYQQKVRLMRPMPSHPVVAGCSEFKDPNLSKTNAEFYGKWHDDGRGNKSLVILHNRYQRLSIQNFSGKEIASSNYYGTFLGGGYRYYIANKVSPVTLSNMLGGEWGLVKAGKECFYFNALRRLSSYR